MTNARRSLRPMFFALCAVLTASTATPTCEGPVTPEVEPNNPAVDAWRNNFYGGCYQPGVWGSTGCFGETVAPVFEGSGQITSGKADPTDNWIFQSNRAGDSQLSIAIDSGTCIGYDVYGCDYQPPFCTSGEPCPQTDPCASYPLKRTGSVCNSSGARQTYVVTSFSRVAPSFIPGITYFRLRLRNGSAPSTSYSFRLDVVS